MKISCARCRIVRLRSKYSEGKQAETAPRLVDAIGIGRLLNVRAGLARARGEGKRLGRPPIAAALEKRIREALAAPGRPGVRVLAKRFGVNPGTMQRISRPFVALSGVAATP